MKLSRSRVVLTIVPLALIVFAAVPAVAAANDFCGFFSNNPMSGIRGARSNIMRYNPETLLAGNASAAWPMVANTSGGYAQIGWAEVRSDWGNNPYYFWEYCSSYGVDPGPIRLTAVPNGGNYTGVDDLFTVDFVGSTIAYRINGVTKATNYWNWTPNIAEFYCETWGNAQIGGDANHRVNFTNSAYKSVNDGNWHLFQTNGSNFNADNSSTNGRLVRPANTQVFQVYDARYQNLP